MATCLFRSPLASRLQSFLELRRRAGRRSVSDEKILLYLDRFLMSELNPGQAISRHVVERWIESMRHLSTGTRLNRLSMLRQFCRYLSYFDSRTCIVFQRFLPRRTRFKPYIYTRQEVRRIMTAAQRSRPRDNLQAAVVSTLVGLLYSTGLRIGEALWVKLGDVDLQRQVIQVREGKFHKSRYVPLSPSTTAQLKVYLRQRQQAGLSTSQGSPLFVNTRGGMYHPVTFATQFLAIVRQLGIRGPKGQRGPRVHDLRHAFAVGRLVQWYREGANLLAKLPLLSTYLGHSTVTGTELYLHATAELLEQAGKRFHNHFAIPPERRIHRHAKH
jgi:integrase/recombinase XerD